MGKFINKLKQNAKKYKEGCLSNYEPVVIYVPYEKKSIHLDGDFSLGELSEIVMHMEQHQHKKKDDYPGRQADLNKPFNIELGEGMKAAIKEEG
jgi:hypothetical protein